MAGGPRGDDLASEAKKGGKHAGKRGKHKERPCPNPPAAPQNVTLTFKVREKKTHLEYSGKIKWDGVFEDEQGHHIPGGGVQIDHYEVQMMATDVDGNAVETEDGHPRVRRWHKKSVKGVKVIEAEMLSGTIAEFTTKKAHNFIAGEKVRVQDVQPPAYNGRFDVMSAGLTSVKFRADIGTTAPKKLETEGTVEGQPDPNYNIIIDHIANPKKFYRIARVRAWDNKQCPSDWSPWTTPAKPTQEARPEPPPPGFVSLTFDRKGRHKHNPWRGKVKISPVGEWDIPGGDNEDDVARYRVKVQVSEDGLTDWRKHDMLHARDHDDETEDDANILLVFHKIRRKFYYRVWLASEDRYNRTGNYAGPFPSTVGVGPGGKPNPVQNVVVTRPAPRRYKAHWDEPVEPEDIDYYKIEWWRRNPLTLMETNRSRNRNDVYRVPEEDKGKAHFPKVYAVDVDDNESTPVQSGDQNETGDFGAADAPGTVKKHAGPNTPTGWLRCNYTQYGTALYPALFGEIAYTYTPPAEVVSNPELFRVPDFRRRQPKGVGTSDLLGDDDGVAESERSDTHGDHNNHKHKHHHRNRRNDHSDDAGQAGDATPHEHYMNLNTSGGYNQVPRGSAASDAAGPEHQHNVIGYTNEGGNHYHGIPASTRRTPGSPYLSGYGQTAHFAHEDSWVEPGAGQWDVYQDSLVGGYRSADGQVWDAGPTDSFGNYTTVDELGAASGHKKHGHLKMHFIIKT